jgi:hypothetical protein
MLLGAPSDCGSVLCWAVVLVLPAAVPLVLGEVLPACALSVPVALPVPLGEVLEALLLGEVEDALLLGEVEAPLEAVFSLDEGELLEAPMLDALPLPQSPRSFTSWPT